MTAPSSPTSPWPLAVVLRRLAADPGRPRLTWYGPDGERIELSGHVLDNWVTKTTNLLVEEFDVGPGTEVLLDLPVHWRTVVWAFAVWRCGGCVVLPVARDAGPSEATVGTHPGLVVTDDPERWAGVPGIEVVAVALPGLARRFDGPLPRGAMDAAAAVLTYGDVLTWLPESDTDHRALLAESEVSHADLLAWADRTAGRDRPAAAPASPSDAGPSPARVLLETRGGTRVDTALAQVLAVHAVDGSVVLCSLDVSAALAADPARRTRLVDTERVTHS
ncbi:MAG: hypothetical protein JWP95_1016 [Actinotalea sp.]|nr:hypothetical protein [Actinotalea sp.]